jgi:hypothetical protein
MSFYKILRFFGCQDTYFKVCPFLPEQHLHHAVKAFRELVAHEFCLVLHGEA